MATAAKPKTGSLVFRASLLSIALIISDVGAVSPVLSELQAHFPGVSQAMIQGFISFPAIAGLLATLTAGTLATTVGKRHIVLTGICLVIIGGLAPYFLVDIAPYPIVLGVRFLAGFGMGLLQPLSTSLIADFYEGQERRTLIGVQSSMIGLGGILWSLVVSALMTMGWRQAFLVYLLGLIILALVWRYVPDPHRAARTGAPEEPRAGAVVPRPGPTARTPLPRGTAGAVAMLALMTLGFQAMTISTPFLAAERHIASGAQVSLVMTAFGVASVIAGILFSTVYRVLRNWTGVFDLACLAAGLALGAVAHSLPVLFCVAILVGLGFGMFMPFGLNAINARTDETNSALTTSLIFAGTSIAGFIAPVIFGFIGGVIGDTSAGAQFATGAAIIVATLVGAIFYYRADARWTRRVEARRTAPEAARADSSAPGASDIAGAPGASAPAGGAV